MTADFRRFEFYNRSEEFVEAVYKLTKRFPVHERYGLSSQLQRASTSISLNIAEACGRRTDKEFVSFLYNAMGSAKECSAILSLSLRLQYMTSEEFSVLNTNVETIAKMLNVYIGKARKVDG